MTPRFQPDRLLTELDALKICAALDALGAGEDDARFEAAAHTLATVSELSREVTEFTLSRLEEAGYVTCFREHGGKPGSYTLWATLSTGGKNALERHLAYLGDVAHG